MVAVVVVVDDVVGGVVDGSIVVEEALNVGRGTDVVLGTFGICDITSLFPGAGINGVQEFGGGCSCQGFIKLLSVTGGGGNRGGMSKKIRKYFEIRH